MNTLFALLPIVILGTVSTFLFSYDFKRFERFALGILIGFGLQTFFMFIFYLFGFRFTAKNSIIEIFALTLIVFLIAVFFKSQRTLISKFINTHEIRSILKGLPKTIYQLDLITKLILVAIAGLVCSSFVVGIFFPVYGWDSLVLYDFRALTFVATGGMEDGISRGYFFGYPLLTSLAHSWMYFFDTNPHVFYWSIYVSFILILYFSLKPFLSKFTLFFTVLVLTSLPTIYTGSYFDYTNFPYLVYLISGILYVCRYTKEKDKSFLVISGILTGLSTWVRQTEPFWIINLFFILLLLSLEIKKKFIHTIVWILIILGLFFAIQQPWRLYETSIIGGGRNVSDQAGYAIKSIRVFNLVRLMDVIGTTINRTVPTWQPYLLIAFFVSLFSRKYIRRASVFLYFVLTNIILLFFGTYIFSYIWPENWKEIIDSQQRLSSFIVPLLIIYTAIISDDFILKGKIVTSSLMTKVFNKILS